ALRQRIPCIEHEVQQRLLELHRVDAHCAEALLEVDPQQDLLAEQAPEQPLDAAEQRVRLDEARKRRRLPGEGEQTVRELVRLLRRAANLLEVVARGTREGGSVQVQVGEAADQQQ